MYDENTKASGRDKLRAMHPDKIKNQRMRMVNVALSYEEYSKAFALAAKSQTSLNRTLRKLIKEGLVDAEK